MRERTTPPSGVRVLSRDVVVLGVIGFFVMLGLGVVIPILPVFVRTFGVGYVELGLIVSAFAVVRLAISPLVGPLIDRLGERTVLTAGTVIVAVSSGLTGIAGSYLDVLLLRSAGGIGSAMFSISAMSLILRTTKESSRGRAMSFFNGGFLIGGMAGPALGGGLAIVSIRAPFFFYAGTLLIAAIIGLALLSRQPKRSATEPDERPVPVPLRAVLRDRGYQAASFANLSIGWVGFGLRNAFVPLLIVEALHRSEFWTGVAFAVSAVAQALALPLAGRLVDTVGRRRTMAAALLLGAITTLALPFVGDYWWLVVLLCLYGIAAAFLGSAPAAAAGDAATGAGAKPIAIFSAMSDLGAIVGPLVGGLLVETLGFVGAFASGFVFMVAASVFSLTMPRRERTGTEPIPVLGAPERPI